jgi:hypothetical protein
VLQLTKTFGNVTKSLLLYEILLLVLEKNDTHSAARKSTAISLSSRLEPKIWAATN